MQYEVYNTLTLRTQYRLFNILTVKSKKLVDHSRKNLWER